VERDGAEVVVMVVVVEELSAERLGVLAHEIQLLDELQDVHDARSVSMVVKRAQDRARLEGEQTNPQLAPCHALDLGAPRSTLAR
jgi:hypothetical protein